MRLHGFNNLSKRLSLSLYDVRYASGTAQRAAYSAYIDATYNATRLAYLLSNVCKMMGANILNIASQDYEPQGASVAVLIAEHPKLTVSQSEPYSMSAPLSDRSDNVFMHLDKSHITVHTYPERHPYNGISTFRADIDVSTCGRISPLNTLNYLIRNFNASIVSIDYQVRGFTRDIKGNKHYLDHEMNSIQYFLAQDIKQHYLMTDINVTQARIFHTKMRLKDWHINNYCLRQMGQNDCSVTSSKVKEILQQEIMDIFTENK